MSTGTLGCTWRLICQRVLLGVLGGWYVNGYSLGVLGGWYVNGYSWVYLEADMSMGTLGCTWTLSVALYRVLGIHISVKYGVREKEMFPRKLYFPMRMCVRKRY